MYYEVINVAGITRYRRLSFDVPKFHREDNTVTESRNRRTTAKRINSMLTKFLFLKIFSLSLSFSLLHSLFHFPFLAVSRSLVLNISLTLVPRSFADLFVATPITLLIYIVYYIYIYICMYTHIYIYVCMYV